MDRRQKKTRNAIFTAFISLLSKKSYDSISIKDIIDEADIGRTTFYTHFETKDNLLHELCNELFDHIISTVFVHTHGSFSGKEATDFIFPHLLWHLKQNDKGIADLLSSENNGIFIHYFKDYLKKLIIAKFPDICQNTELPEDFYLNHIASTFIETAVWWISHGMIETPEEIAAYFYSVTHLFLE